MNTSVSKSNQYEMLAAQSSLINKEWIKGIHLPTIQCGLSIIVLQLCKQKIIESRFGCSYHLLNLNGGHASPYAITLRETSRFVQPGAIVMPAKAGMTKALK